MKDNAKARILVIDDDVRIIALLKKTLDSNGCVVVEASDGKEGIKLYRETKPDLVITDIMMPGETGIAVIDKLRREFPAVKIIAISAGSSDAGTDFLRMAKILGASCVLHKPIDRNKLLEVVDELIEKP